MRRLDHIRLLHWVKQKVPDGHQVILVVVAPDGRSTTTSTLAAPLVPVAMVNAAAQMQAALKQGAAEVAGA